VRNAGTKVSPPFARWNLTSTRGKDSALWILPMLLPKSAQYAYLKDDLGLMQLVTTAKDAALSAKLIPRYPLLGGWSTEMILGYSLPLPSTVAQKGGVHTLTFLLGPLVEYVRPSSVKRYLLLLFCRAKSGNMLGSSPSCRNRRARESTTHAHCYGCRIPSGLPCSPLRLFCSSCSLGCDAVPLFVKISPPKV
jgi:hypothetical protein